MNAKPFDTRELKKKIIRHEAIKLDLHQIKTRELQERSCHRVIKANNKTAAAGKTLRSPKTSYSPHILQFKSYKCYGFKVTRGLTLYICLLTTAVLTYL